MHERMLHASCQLPVWLIFDVGRKFVEAYAMRRSEVIFSEKASAVCRDQKRVQHPGEDPEKRSERQTTTFVASAKRKIVVSYSGEKYTLFIFPRGRRLRLPNKAPEPTRGS